MIRMKAQRNKEDTDIYIKPTPIQKFKIKVRIKSIEKGQLKIFPDEFKEL